MTVGYEVAGGEAGRAEQVRIMLFTDVQPNVGLTEASEFERLARSGADSGAGLTVFALGLGLNPDVLRGMSQIRNANAFSLTEDVASLMEDSWPWMASPIAHELVLRVTASEGFTVTEGYGFPESTVDEASMSVSSVFLSRRRGALLLRIQAEAEGEPSFDALTVDLSLEYETLDGEFRSEAFTKGFSALNDQAPFEQASVHKTVALARLVSAMKEAAEIYGTDQDGAVGVQQRAHTQFEEALTELEDPALEPERELSAALLELMRSGASQDSFYGGF
jgi:Ca-activated chloride channel family protein